MPSLNWIGKDAVVSHQNDVPFHLLPSTRSCRLARCGKKRALIIACM